MTSCWERAATSGRPLPESVEAIAAWMPEGPAPARSALDLALTDRLARKSGKPLYAFLGLPKPPNLTTSVPIAIDEPHEMARMAQDIPDYGVIKLKLGSDDDEARVKAVRAARPDAKLRVDANAGWTLDQAMHHLKWLEKYDLELIEQPLPKEQL